MPESQPLMFDTWSHFSTTRRGPSSSTIPDPGQFVALSSSVRKTAHMYAALGPPEHNESMKA
ncbi:hypothetical protein GN244_ATG06192 [Phytophthora infestans]|uniref:Uncharacterized protein n=1 Tax=Phytophthora infestans TaxID=4787 RepID=A0A833WM38_PHYIN|nr:hypothetical protein GN244_ATG06192 [Phytophthora infestans]